MNIGLSIFCFVFIPKAVDGVLLESTVAESRYVPLIGNTTRADSENVLKYWLL